MRKILSGLLSTAILSSLCATSAFATSRTTSPVHTFTILEAMHFDGTGWVGEGVYESTGYEILRLSLDEDTTDSEPASETSINASFLSPATDDPEALAGLLAGKSFSGVEFNGKTYTVTLVKESGKGRQSLKAEFSPAQNMTEGGDAKYQNFSKTGISLSAKPANSANFDKVAALSPLSFITSSGNSDDIIGGPADIEASGDLETVDILDAVFCDKNGNPIPLTENAQGVQQDQNGEQGTQSSKTLYFMIQEGDYNFDNENFWKLKINKGKNSKILKSVTDVSKHFDDNLYSAYSENEISNSNGRHRFIKIELNELYTDDEYKVALDLTLSAKSAAERIYNIEEGSSLKVNDFTFYVKNLVKNADNDWRIGINGLVLEPTGNDWNNVTYYDEDSDVAFVKFFGDSDVGKFYAKLSSKWEHADYAAYFNDQDAFYFEFTGSPQLSSTSRADLQIYNPFLDENGNETIDPKTATIYQIVDGDLIDVTESFTFGEGANGENAYIARTRFLGSYILCEKAVDTSSFLKNK